MVGASELGKDKRPVERRLADRVTAEQHVWTTATDFISRRECFWASILASRSFDVLFVKVVDIVWTSLRCRLKSGHSYQQAHYFPPNSLCGMKLKTEWSTKHAITDHKIRINHMFIGGMNSICVFIGVVFPRVDKFLDAVYLRSFTKDLFKLPST